MPHDENPPPSFFARFALAFVLFWRLLFNPELAQKVLPVHRGEPALPSGLPTEEPQAAAPLPAAEPAAPAPHTAGLYVLSLLQREGRLVDFLQEEVAPFSDAEVGAAARVVHEGCRKALRQLVDLAPVYTEDEGARVTVPPGYDAQRIQLTGNVAGQPPHVGELKHRGWTVTAERFPEISPAVDARVLAPAEVELS
ncbi:MAG TPA: DUF2760 domain-containing protein [Myxococcaceae bacterium]|nr:DUF2760 domain-containing protein [Myxococcaceae bacterium]